jgi:sugar/nucleoside kinase (ribokinase family)
MMIGHFAKDRLVVDGASRVASGGAVYYGGIALQRIGVRVAVVTRLHPGDRARLSELIKEGIQVFATDAPETSGIENVYDSADMERRICRPLGFAGPFRRSDMPVLPARVYLISPIIAGEVDLSLLRWLSSQGPVGLDVQGFVRVREGDRLVFRQWPDMAEGLSFVTYLKADRAEAELMTGQTDLCAAAEMLAAYGPQEIVLTQSAGVTVYANGQFYNAPFVSRSLAGRTGRGDTCFSTYVGKRLTCSPAQACRFAAAVTSIKQEHPGPWNGLLSDVESLLAEADGLRV